MPNVPTCFTWPTCSTCLRCSSTLRALRVHLPKYILQTGKTQNIGFNDNYNPQSQNDLSFINEFNLALNFLSPFNMSTENPNLKNFMCSFDLESLINSPTCYKSIGPTCIDLILTNKKNHFMKSATFETALSDHNKLTTTILTKTVQKDNSKEIFYRDYKRFDKKKFETEMKLKLS